MRLVVLLPVVLRAALVMSADGVEIGVVRERILRDQRNVASVKFRIPRFLPRRGEALRKNHVRGIEPPGIGAAEQNRVLRHLRVDRATVILRARWRKHVVAVPVAKQVAALLALLPVCQPRPDRHQRQYDQHDANWRRLGFFRAAPWPVHKYQRPEKHQEAKGKPTRPVIEEKLRLGQLGRPICQRNSSCHHRQREEPIPK